MTGIHRASAESSAPPLAVGRALTGGGGAVAPGLLSQTSSFPRGTSWIPDNPEHAGRGLASGHPAHLPSLHKASSRCVLSPCLRGGWMGT